jgi:glycosyltransferase involved in cell wall biosynthesis
VEAWCPATADADFLPLASLVTEHRQPSIGARPRVAPTWLHRAAGADWRGPERMAAIDAHAAAFVAEVRARGFDLVFAGGCRWLSVPPRLADAGIPTVTYLNEPFRMSYEARPNLPWVSETLDRNAVPSVRNWVGSALRLHPLRLQAKWEWDNVRSFNRVLVNSAFSRESVLRTYGAESTVCYLGVDTNLFQSADRPRQAHVLSVGTFQPDKNAEFVIRAIAQSHHKPALRWVANTVAPAYVDRMTQLARDLSCRLEIVRSVSDAELVLEYQTASLMLYAPRLEPFGLAPLEAGSCGLPVIGVAEGGVRESIRHGENGLLVDDLRGMSEAIDRLLTDADEARSLGSRAAARVRKHWTIDGAADRLEAHLRQAVMS